jgi:hypothetical protein
MRATRLFALILLLPLSATASSEDLDDWKLIGGMLALVQQIVHLAATSPDPDTAQKGVDAILSGENAQANRIASGVLDEVLQEVPAEQRGAFVAIGRDLLVLAQRERARAGGESTALQAMDPVQARKELQAMGLKYWDEQQFLEAVRRGDRIAVDLYLAAKGLQSSEARNPPPAR